MTEVELNRQCLQCGKQDAITWEAHSFEVVDGDTPKKLYGHVGDCKFCRVTSFDPHLAAELLRMGYLAELKVQ